MLTFHLDKDRDDSGQATILRDPQSAYIEITLVYFMCLHITHRFYSYQQPYLTNLRLLFSSFSSISQDFAHVGRNGGAISKATAKR